MTIASGGEVAGACLDISLQGRTRAGPGALAQLPGILARLGAHRVLLVTDGGVRAAGLVDRVLATLGEQVEVTVHDTIPANPTTDAVHAAAADARTMRAEALVALGGGSPLDAAKAVAWVACAGGEAEPTTPPIPIVAIPTTAGTGAETNGFGVIEDTRVPAKTYLGHASTTPAEVILDPELTLGLPAPVTAATGFDALIHAVESLTSRGANPFSRACAAESLRLTTEALPHAVIDGATVEYRFRQLVAANLAGRALTLSGLGLVHGLAHALTAMTGTPHGVALAAFAEAAIGVQAPHHPRLYASVAEIWRIDDRDATDATNAARVPAAVGELARRIGIVRPLGELGMTAEGVPGLVRTALADPVTANTPYSASDEELHELVHQLL